MDCSHCGIAFHEQPQHVDIIGIAQLKIRLARSTPDPAIRWELIINTCPACKNDIIDLIRAEYTTGNSSVLTGSLDEISRTIFRVYPHNNFRKPTPGEVPDDIKADYEEACRVLPISAKASAALSRRCLQAVLRNQGYHQRDLFQQIDALLTEQDRTKTVPTALHSTIDAIRNFGNFSARRVNDQTTLQIIDVEPEEADWCLEILEQVFDHYYVKPAHAKARKDALDQKLKLGGKPPSK